MLYTPPTGGAANDPYVGANIPAGIQGSKVPPNAIEYPQRELVALITAAGLVPTNGDLQQALRAVRSGLLEYYADTGAVNAPSIAPQPAHTQLVDGLHVRVRMKYAPTGPANFTISGLQAPVQRLRGAALAGNEWQPNDVVDLVYNGARNAFQIAGLTPSDIPPASYYGAAPNGGLNLSGSAFGLNLDNLPVETGISDADKVALQTEEAEDGLASGVPFAATAGSLAAYVLTKVVASNTFQLVVPNPVLYVRTDGSDSNNGLANTAAGAFKTIATAVQAGVSKYNFATTSLTIQLGIPSTYACPANFPSVPGLLVIQGDPANQDSYILTSAGNAGSGCFNAAGTMRLVGVQVQNTGTVSPTLTAGGGSQIGLFNVSLVNTQTNPNAHVLADYGGSISISASCKVQGNSAAALQAIAGNIAVDASITLVGTPTFSTATVQASNGGEVGFFGGNLSGSANGPRYNASTYGVVNTGTGNANFIPGSSAGSAPSGTYT